MQQLRIGAWPSLMTLQDLWPQTQRLTCLGESWQLLGHQRLVHLPWLPMAKQRHQQASDCKLLQSAM